MLDRPDGRLLEGSPFDNVIWEGRFQPIHKGHVEYVKTLLQYARHVWVFVVENEVSTDVSSGGDLPVPEFSHEVDEHHVDEKNPFPFWLRYRMVVETLLEELPGAPITVWGGRRLDLLWPFYRRALPPNRVFLTPTRDSFEDAKARAWQQLGERVVRIDTSAFPPVSATLVRQRLLSGDAVSDVLCKSTERLLREFLATTNGRVN